MKHKTIQQLRDDLKKVLKRARPKQLKKLRKAYHGKRLKKWWSDFVHSFSYALDRLKEGKRIHRSGWNGKRMFLTLQEGSTVTGTMMRNKPARDFYGDGEVKICPHIDMKAADGSYVVGWLASQTDMLANDWAIAD